MINYTDKALHYLGKNETDIKSICIGAMDGIMFDTFSGYIHMYNIPTLYVEPIPEQYKRLKENITNPIHTFENAAISTYDGEIEMLTIDVDAIDSKLLHPCFYGMSSIYPPKNGLASEGDRETVEKFGKKIFVPCMTLDTLFTKHNVTKIDLFKCDTEGHDYPIFKQLDFTKYRPKLIYLEWINMTKDEQDDVIRIFVENNYEYEIDGMDIAAVPAEFVPTLLNPEVPKEEPAPEPTFVPAPEPPKRQNTTIVTGLWDLGRGELDGGFGRSFDHYMQKFEELLKSDAYMYIHVPQSLEEWVRERRDMTKTVIRVIEADYFKQYFAFYNEVNTIRQQPEWYNYAGWLSSSPQARLELYNPIVMSKMFLLNDATIFNPFNTDYFFWIDGGITNTVHWGYFQKDRVFDNLEYYYEIENKFLYLSYPYEGNEEIHGFKREGMNKYCGVDYVGRVMRGGFFGGRKDHINNLNNLYYNYLQTSLRDGYMGTEESIFTIIAHRHADLVQEFIIGGDGLIWPFFEHVKDIKQRVKVSEMVKKPFSEIKVSLYAITFNIPEQFEVLNKAFLNSDSNFLTKPRKILLNNSTDRTTDEEYDRLCTEYGWEEIHKDNIGICRGRQWCAEHFDESDSDYYLFFEDDFLLNPPLNAFDAMGFRKYVDGLYDKTIRIIHETGYDFIKLNFVELYGNNSTNWAWYNVPQTIREEYFPEKTQLPVHGLDPNAPLTKFNTIKNLYGISVADGEVYYCNWPHIMDRKGNRKVFLDTIFAHPYEGTQMSFVFQELKKGHIKPAILLLSPFTHDRIKYYGPNERREN